MLDGTYDIVADTPLGTQRGTAVIKTAEGGKGSAAVDMGSLGTEEMKGSFEGDTFRAKGTRRQFPFGKVDYELSGKVDGDRLIAELKSKVADITITGTRRA